MTNDATIGYLHGIVIARFCFASNFLTAGVLLMSPRIPLVASCAFICAGLAVTTPGFAVNFEIAAAPLNQLLHVNTYAQMNSTLTGPSSAENGGVSLPDIGAASEAGALENDEIIAYTEAAVGVYTDLGLDSPTAMISLLTPGSTPPPDVSGVPHNQRATGFSSAHDFTYQASLTSSSVMLDDDLNPITIDWVIDVLPSAGEIPGTATLVHIDAVVEGLLATTGSGIANASWQVTVNEVTHLQFGSAAAGGGASLPFADADSHDLILPLGSSFKLRFEWNLSVSGSNPGSSDAEFTAAKVVLSAELVPEPCSLLLFGIGAVGLATRRP